MMEKRKEKNRSITIEFEEQGSNQSFLWMITFTDILALMLVFFIMNYAMSAVEQGKWEVVSESLNNSFKSTNIVESSIKGAPLSSDTMDRNAARDLDYLYAILADKIEQDLFLSRNVAIKKFSDVIELQLSTAMLFEYGDDYITEDGQIALFAIGNIISQISNKMEIEVIADKLPLLNKEKFESNIQLSLYRGRRIANEFLKFGSNSKIEIYTSKINPQKRNRKKENEGFGQVKMVIRKFVDSN